MDHDADSALVPDGQRGMRRMATTCQVTVPEALAAFWEADSFEQCIELAISVGGDTDTRAAIAGSVAEAFWSIPEDWRGAARSRLPSPLLALLDDFDRTVAQQPLAMLDRSFPPFGPGRFPA